MPHTLQGRSGCRLVEGKGDEEDEPEGGDASGFLIFFIFEENHHGHNRPHHR